MREGRKKILVLDPEPFVQELLRLKLEAACGEVLFAEDEKEAKKILLEQEVDLIILEILHPRLDSYRFVQWLKNHPGLETIKVLILTFKKKDPEIFFLYNVWIAGYLEKPFLPELLSKKVKELLKGAGGN